MAGMDTATREMERAMSLWGTEGRGQDGFVTLPLCITMALYLWDLPLRRRADERLRENLLCARLNK